MHIQRNRRMYKNKVYTSVLLRQCYYEKGKIRQKTIANLSKMPESLVRTIELAVKKGQVYYKLDDLNFEDAFSYGHIAALDSLIRDIGLDKTIYSKPNDKQNLVQAMIICRIVHPASELGTMRWLLSQEGFREFYNLDYSELRVDDLYYTLDWLEKRQDKIETKIYTQRNEKPNLFLYDITSSYFEGDNAELSDYGYNRDKKRGKKQIVIGLVTDKAGYPLSIEVFKGNTSDQSTIIPLLQKLKKKYEVQDAIIIGDRGMITESKLDSIEKNGFKYITALTHERIEKLIKDSSTPFQLELFDERNIVEIEWEGRRHILCKNNERGKKEAKTFLELIDKTKLKLEGIKRAVDNRRLKNVDKIAKRVGIWQNKWKVGKYFDTKISKGKFEYSLKEGDIELNKELCGCYVIISSVSCEKMSSKEIIEHYKKLCLVERAFEIIKTSLLRIRPIYHWKGNRIKAHAFLCMLSYYVVLELKNRLRELFSENGTGNGYKWTLEGILEQLKNIKIGYIKVREFKIRQLKKLTLEQKRILKYLGVELKITKEVIH